VKDKKIYEEMKRTVLIVLGTFFVILGIIGVFLPLLPTTPFLLLAAACYARGSEKFYRWLLSNRWFGKYIKNYKEGKGIPLKAKIFSISMLWFLIMFSALFVVSLLLLRIVLILIAVGVTLHLLRIPTFRE